MDTDRVLSIFAVLTGLSGRSMEEQRYLCGLSAAEVAEMIGEGADISCDRVEYAAAALAYYRYLLTAVSDPSSEIRVGEISVKKDASRLEYAERLYKEALADIGVSTDDDFVFRAFG